MRTSFIKLFWFLVDTNLYVIIPITALVVETYLMAGHISFNPDLLLFILFATLMLYPLHRLIGAQNVPSFERNRMHLHVLENTRTILFFISIGLGGAAYYFVLLPVKIQAAIALSALFSLGYTLPIIPSKNGWLRLRDIPFLKIYIISGIVAFVTTTLPLVDVGGVGLWNHLMMFAMRFIFILAITIPFDARDIPYDKRWGLKTIPILLGEERAVNLAKFLLHFTTIIAFLLAFLTRFFSYYVFLALFLSEILTAYVLNGYKKNKSELYLVVLIEGTMVYQFALVALAVILAG